MAPAEWRELADGIDRLVRMIWSGEVSFPGRSDGEMLHAAQSLAMVAHEIRDKHKDPNQ